MSLFFVHIVLGLFQTDATQSYRYDYAPMEKIHNKAMYTTTLNPIVDPATGTRRPDQRHTPDFRVTQPMLEPFDHKPYEHHRPYRVSPHYKQTYYFRNQMRADLYGCYCTTVFKRLRLLAGCAVITSRHILTTATSTHLILRKYKKAKNLEGILGYWYDVDKNWFNSSIYGTPCRIHYHPLYAPPEKVNRSHPFPVMYDISVWAATIRHHSNTVLCERGGPHKWDWVAATPNYASLYNVFGFQFMRAYRRDPQPWYKYTVKMVYPDYTVPCPKTEWGWYHCFRTESFAPLGMDNGAALHRRTIDYYRYDGLIGLNVLSMKLRSVAMMSYFIDLNNYRVLDFLYDAYLGRLPYAYLDNRFYNSINSAPYAKISMNWYYPHPYEHYSRVHCCLPERFRPAN